MSNEKATFISGFQQVADKLKQAEQEPTSLLGRIFKSVSITELRLMLLGVSLATGAVFVIVYIALAPVPAATLGMIMAFCVGCALTFSGGMALLKKIFIDKKQRALREAAAAFYPPTGIDLLNRFLDNKTSPYVKRIRNEASFSDTLYLRFFLEETLLVLKEVEANRQVLAKDEQRLVQHMREAGYSQITNADLEAFFAFLNRLNADEQEAKQGAQSFVNKQIMHFDALGVIDWAAVCERYA